MTTKEIVKKQLERLLRMNKKISPEKYDKFWALLVKTEDLYKSLHS
jgi:hypothetical protein